MGRPARAMRALAVAVLVLAPFGASAEDTTSRTSADTPKMDFSKAPWEVECFDKCKIAVTGNKDTKGHLTLFVSGAAYYPDDTIYYVTVRHAKLDTVFARVGCTVKNHAFSATLGPFQSMVPGGELVIDAWFDFIVQPGRIKATIWPGRATMGDAMHHAGYFHCPNGCKWDKKNLVIARYNNGGAAAQAQDEQAEKDEFAKCRTSLLDARKTAIADFAKGGPTGAAATLKQVEADVQTALVNLNKWRVTQLFVVFPKLEEDTARLGNLILTEERLRAQKLGVGAMTQNLDGQIETATKELEEKSDSIKGFIEEKDSLDKLWEEFKKTHKGAAQQEAAKLSGEHPQGDQGPGGK